MQKHLSFSLLIIFAGLLAVNACDEPALMRFAFTEPHMGTTFRIVLYAKDEAAAKKAAAAAFARIAELNHIMSDYQDDSELMKVCKAARSHPVEISVDLFKVLEKAQEVSRQSDGAFDVSIGPVVRLWRKARRTHEMPDAAAIKKALELVDYRKIRLDPKGRTVQLLLIGMMLDLGGIAKGYAADAALEVLRQHGITRALVAAGGDIAVGEPPPDAPGWKIGVAPLEDSKEPSEFVSLKNAAVSTSGDLHQFVEIAGKRYSHIMDPKTGLGLMGRRSVTIIAPDCTTTDAWATAICVVGPKRGLKMIESQKGMAGLLIFETEKGIQTTMSKNYVNYRWKQ
ncbi:MAG: FAD:protein FMN transferase [Planctomycetes bacterium]|nr:FAD:protein FMN transferase [Planctomycetota bacterium]